MYEEIHPAGYCLRNYIYFHWHICT